MLGVSYTLLYCVRSVQKGSEVSCQPMSSTRKRMMLGRRALPALSLGAAAAVAVTASEAAAKAKDLFIS